MAIIRKTRTSFSNTQKICNSVKFHCIPQRIIIYIMHSKKKESCYPVNGLEQLINLELLYRDIAAFVICLLVFHF